MPPRDWKIRIKDILAAKIPDAIRKAHPSIPWADMVAMRNFVVHEYFGVTNEVLWTTLQQDLPQLVPLLKKLLT